MVVCSDDQSHDFEDGSKVCFSEVQGMTELNSIGPVEIKDCSSVLFFLKWLQNI